MSQTPCHEAIATATYTWEVAYFSDRFRNTPNRQRRETFATATVINRNGQKPAVNVIGPDDQGVWWPVLPPRPTADEVDARRQTLEMNDPPQIQKDVNYVLQCEDDRFLATAEVYRRVARALEAGQRVRASYSLGQLLQTEIVD